MNPEHERAAIHRLPDRHRQVLELLKREGRMTVAALAHRLGISTMAVRQHLGALRRDELIRYTTERQGLGRPRHVYELTETGDELFPRGYAQLSRSLLEAARETFGEAGLAGLLRRRNAALRTHYRARLDGRPLVERVAELARLRSEEGYMAGWEAVDERTFRLKEDNCAICQVARSCPQACDFELELFRETLHGAHVTREEHLLRGDRRCTYLIRAG